MSLTWGLIMSKLGRREQSLRTMNRHIADFAGQCFIADGDNERPERGRPRKRTDGLTDLTDNDKRKS